MNSTIELAEPSYAWLLAVVAALTVLVARKAVLWHRDVRAMRSRRVVPGPERLRRLGPWPFWSLVLGALTLSVLALARPQVKTARPHTPGIDLIVLQDGSASMHVRDLGMTRWQRSMHFVRALAEAIEWTDDRMALALFARIAAPQVRLTRDPNTIFFFLDHLTRESPFPLADDTTWDTNIELGLHWGMRLLERDEELNGVSDNAKAFVLLSDGQAWSGEVDAALTRARARNIPVFVIGVGTQEGGMIPEPLPDPFRPAPPPGPPIRSALDRPALQQIAAAGRGAYFDLGSQPDAILAATILNRGRQIAGSRGVEETFADIYWWCLAGAALCLVSSALFAYGRTEAVLQSLAVAVAVAIGLAIWN
jgi:Ca-activated chloride channel family protein